MNETKSNINTNTQEDEHYTLKLTDSEITTILHSLYFVEIANRILKDTTNLRKKIIQEIKGVEYGK